MKLFEIQKWFGNTLMQPLTEDHVLPKHSQEQAARYIVKSPTLFPHQRIEIYYQQYWWRLLKALQTNFPTLVRLFGQKEFERKIAVPYLSEHPPTHWALCRLGATLPDWLEQTYHASDRYLVVHASQIDWAAQKAFWVAPLPKVAFENLSPEQTQTAMIRLQPHIRLFSLQGDLFSFRDVFLEQEPDYYHTHPFPEMHYGEFKFVLYRTPQNHVSWKQILPSEYSLLSKFMNPTTIRKVCSLIEKQKGPHLEEIFSQIPFWFKEWTVLEWFGLSSE